MNTRLTTVAALALALVAPAGSALAQSYTAPAGIPAATAQSVYAFEHDDDVVATGSIGTRRPDGSAKAGNADRPELTVPNLGGTSGGPAY
jgi:hypothetical protein